MRYERPAIERRVKTTNPVIAGTLVSPPVLTAKWAPHDTTTIAPGNTDRETS